MNVEVELHRVFDEMDDELIEHLQRDLAAARAEAEANMKGNLMWFAEAKKAHAEAQKYQDLLKRLLEWDHLDGSADGPYWRKEITKALGEK